MECEKIKKIEYSSASEDTNNLLKKGYNLNFSIKDGNLVVGQDKYDINKFQIDETYRYEGETNPSDSAVIYAISSKAGKKGILIASYGVYSDELSKKLLEKLDR